MKKYRNIKTTVDGITFDSKKEGKYYQFIKGYCKKNGYTFQTQEKFILQETFRFGGKTYRSITYKPDFTIYKDGKLIKVVDVKGVRTTAFNLKVKLFTKKYNMPIVLAIYDYRSGIFREEIA